MSKEPSIIVQQRLQVLSNDQKFRSARISDPLHAALMTIKVRERLRSLDDAIRFLLAREYPDSGSSVGVVDEDEVEVAKHDERGTTTSKDKRPKH